MEVSLISMVDFHQPFLWRCFQRRHEPMGRGFTTSRRTQRPSQPRWRQPQARGTSWDIFISRVSERWKCQKPWKPMEHQSSRGASDSLKTSKNSVSHWISSMSAGFFHQQKWQPTASSSSFFQFHFTAIPSHRPSSQHMFSRSKSRHPGFRPWSQGLKMSASLCWWRAPNVEMIPYIIIRGVYHMHMPCITIYNLVGGLEHFLFPIYWE